MNGAVEISRRHDEWRSQCINLIPSENIMSPAAAALLAGDMATRYTLPIDSEVHGSFVENAYRGTRYTDEAQALAEGLAREIFRAKHATFAPLSGHIAGLIVLSGLCSKGDLIMSLDSDSGGYDGYVRGNMPDMLGLRWKPLAFDPSVWNLDVGECARQIRSERPKLVILGGSFFPFPHDVGAISDACDDAGSVLAYDGCHVFGLMAGSQFQDPLAEGADVLIGNTHKSFFGPQGGALLTNDSEIFGKFTGNLTWKTVDNLHWNRIAATAKALEEMREFGRDYAAAVVANSKALASALAEGGLQPMFGDLGFSESHQVILDAGAVDTDFNSMAVTLENNNIITDAVGRLGTSEISRLGMDPADMEKVADFILRAAGGENVLEDVVGFRSAFDIKYC